MNRAEKGRVESLEEVRICIADRLHSRSTELEEAIVARIRNVASDPAGSGDVHYEEGQRMAVVAALDYALSGIEHGEERASPIPSDVVAQAHRAARNGVGLDTILRRYTAGYALLGDFVMQEADRGGLLGRGAALRAVQRTQASLLDRLIVSVSEEYGREVQRVVRSPDQRRAELVQRLLAGELVDVSGLKYEFEAWHLGIIATGPEAETAVRGLLAAGLGRQLLPIRRSEQTVWAWLGNPRRPTTAEVERFASANVPVDVSLAVGEPAEGLDGWRLTHWQAQDALLVALRRPQMLTLYADIALLVPWLRDDARAQWLVEMHLSPLDNHRCSGAALRKTLREYFAAGHNASAAARTLYVSRRTMRNRMVLIEESLGSLLHERQAELELALRLDELLADNSRRL
jgi:hypothetical protein